MMALTSYLGSWGSACPCSVNDSCPCSVNGACPCSGNGSCPCSGNGSCPCSGNGSCPCSVNGSCPCSGNGSCPCSGNGACPCSGNGSCPCSGNGSSVGQGCGSCVDQDYETYSMTHTPHELIMVTLSYCNRLHDRVVGKMAHSYGSSAPYLDLLLRSLLFWRSCSCCAALSRSEPILELQLRRTLILVLLKSREPGHVVLWHACA